MKRGVGYSWVSKKVLVTGAGGFIGSHLCQELVSLGADVTAMIRYTGRSDWGNLAFLSAEEKSALTVIAGNVEDSDFVSWAVKGKEVVFHLAALIGIPYSYIAPRSYVRTNVEGTLNVLEAARINSVQKVVHTSTSETYGTAIYTPIDEKHPLQGQSPYSASKIGADKIAESYYRSFDLPVATIRPFNTYGPRQSARAIIPTIISQAFKGPEIRLGSLEPVRDFTYVKDMVKAFVGIAGDESSVGETINVGTSKGITVGNLVGTILKIMNSDKPVVVEENRIRPPKSEVYKLICDNKRLIEHIDWTPRYSLEKGLAETIEFVRTYLDRFKTNYYTL